MKLGMISDRCAAAVVATCLATTPMILTPSIAGAMESSPSGITAPWPYSQQVKTPTAATEDAGLQTSPLIEELKRRTEANTEKNAAYVKQATNANAASQLKVGGSASFARPGGTATEVPEFTEGMTAEEKAAAKAAKKEAEVAAKAAKEAEKQAEEEAKKAAKEAEKEAKKAAQAAARAAIERLKADVAEEARQRAAAKGLPPPTSIFGKEGLPKLIFGGKKTPTSTPSPVEPIADSLEPAAAAD
jgi:hypothetical protein